MTMTPSYSTSVFTPDAVATISRAYAEAVDIVGVAAEQPDLRPELAEHIMFLARHGEDDERRLCQLAVLAFLGRIPEGRREAAETHANHGR